MKKNYILLTIISITVILIKPSFLFAQDIRFAQSYANPLLINPAIMGANSDIKAVLNYRSQWASIDKGYKTYSFTGMYPIFLNDGKNKFDVGLSTISDKAGAFKTFSMGLSIDYTKEIAPNNNLCLSIIGGFMQRSFDISNQTFDYQYVQGSYSASNPSNELTLGKNESHPDLGFGFMWFYNPSRTKSKINAFAGFSGYHLNQPNETLLGSKSTLPMRFSYQGGVKFFGDNKIDISPNIRVNFQNGNIEPAAGLYADYNFSDNAKLVIGGWYRAHDAIAFLIGFEHKNFILGYSYDMVNSGLNQVAPGVNAHELTIAIKLSRLAKAKNASFDDENIIKPSVRSSPFSSF